MNWEVRTMRSVTSCFNSTLYRKNLSRFWPIWALYSVIWLFALPSICSPRSSGGRTGLWRTLRTAWTIFPGSRWATP